MANWPKKLTKIVALLKEKIAFDYIGLYPDAESEWKLELNWPEGSPADYGKITAVIYLKAPG